MSFFMTADDIDDNLSIFEGGVESIGDEFLIIDGVDNNVNAVVLAVNIDNGPEESFFVISRFGNMFEFINAFMVFCNLLSVFVDGEEVLGADAVCGIVICSALTTTMAMATTMV